MHVVSIWMIWMCKFCEICWLVWLPGIAESLVVMLNLFQPVDGYTLCIPKSGREPRLSSRGKRSVSSTWKVTISPLMATFESYVEHHLVFQLILTTKNSLNPSASSPSDTTAGRFAMTGGWRRFMKLIVSSWGPDEYSWLSVEAIHILYETGWTRFWNWNSSPVTHVMFKPAAVRNACLNIRPCLHTLSACFLFPWAEMIFLPLYHL